MTVPVGKPIWDRSATIAQYGGSATKRNYGNIGAVNSSTDITAEQYLRLVADVQALAQVSPICTIGFLWAPTTTNSVVSVVCAWAPQLTTSYGGTTPPSSAYPTLTQLSTSRAVITLPATAADAFGVSAGLVVRYAFPNSSASTEFWEGPLGNNVAQIGGLPTTGTTRVSVVIW